MIEQDVKDALDSFSDSSGRHFDDIQSEQFRVYVFVHDGKRVEVRIDNPLRLNVSDSGGHRIYDVTGTCHYIPSGWIHLYWKAKPDWPHFVK